MWTTLLKDSAMKHSRISRNVAKAFFAFAALAIVGACADSTAIAPAPDAPAFVAPANFLQVGSSITFRVDNAYGSTQRLDDHVISIPAGAICDIATSGYGADYWGKPCSPMRGSVVVTATVLEGPDGAPYIDFQPAMRFAPNKEVVLFFRDNAYGTKNLAINYCDNAGNCIDESLTNPALKPFRINSYIVGRRLAHFSGYVVAYDLGLININISLLRKSGYMVASGENITDIMTDDDDQGSPKKPGRK
jgi:hypothetical protein